MAEKSPAKGPRASRETDPFRAYEERFIASPDPWTEIGRLDHGTDRTFGSTVRAMVMNAEPAQRPAMETKLLAVLARTDATDVARLFACRMLALIGSAKAVPALAALLGDAKTVDAARYALDAIDDPSVDDAYRGALEKLSGPAKAGLIGSIALRGDAQAIPALTAIKGRTAEPQLVRTAATRALERLQAKA
jgi:thioredoxin-like negative regulator of GroEL